MTTRGAEPAYPSHEGLFRYDQATGHTEPVGGPGLSKRELFAGMAMQNPAICTGQAPEYELAKWFGGRGGIRREEIVAKQAVMAADALLAELECTR